MDKVLLIVLMMGIVTHVPRVLPLALLNNLKLPPYLNSFLQFIPYAVLGALIFPGILSSTGDVQSALAGGITASILALLRLNIIIIVLGGILGVYLFKL